MTHLGNDDLRFAEWSGQVHDHLVAFLDGLATSAADSRLPSPPAAAPYEPPAGPEPLDDLLARVERAASDAVETSGPRCFAYFPSGGLTSAALGELTSLVLNRYTGVTSMAPSLARVEQSLVEWMCREDLAAEHGLWFHVDAAYGGGFVLTERGRRVLTGAERADSFAFDPHKSLFMPYGTGVLLVRSRADLVAAHAADGDYLQDLDDLDGLPDVSDLGPELTREYRALRVLFPLHLHGVDAFRSALDDTLDLAARLHAELAADERLVVGAAPDLTVVTFASADGDDATRELVRRVNEGRRVFVSSTQVEGRYTARARVLSHRTREADVRELASTVRAAAARTTASV